MTQRLDIQSTTTNGNNCVVLLEECVEQAQCIFLVGEYVVRLVDRAAGNEMVGCAGKFLRRRPGHSDVHL